MWQLELLGRVLPAFGALAKELTENERQAARLQSAHDCYADILSIGQAIYLSGGEWAPGLENIDFRKLLKAFETRFPTRKRAFHVISAAWKSDEVTNMKTGDRAQFPQLNALACSMEATGWGGYDECYDILNQTREKHGRYLAFLGEGVSLFHKSESRDPVERAKFIKRVHIAATGLLDVYCKEGSGPDSENSSLSQHPSQGMKHFADRVYTILEQHWRCSCLERYWRCSCPQRPERPIGAREARLSLIRHRQFIPTSSGRTQVPVKFEILFPVCKDTIEWKVANVEVKDSRSQEVATAARKAINCDVCQYLRKSDRITQVDFLIENEKLWHLKPKLHEGTNYHTSMEPLHQLLGDGLEISSIEQCRPREQLILCYILASSMLYLYPSSWFQTQWNSSMVYFIRRSSNSTSPVLRYPYVSVEFQPCNNMKSPPDHMQIHTHPAILALGIIFLEIATGTRFKRTQRDTLWEQCNEDNDQAWQLLIQLEKNDRHSRTKRVPSSLSRAIRACLKLEPPPSFPSNRLSEEGPIRHYILSCIVWPLARGLQDGYKVPLENLHDLSIPQKEKEDPYDIDGTKSPNRQSTASIETITFNNRTTNTQNFEANSQSSFQPEFAVSFAERREACSYRDREEYVDEKKVKIASSWFDWHNDALARISQLRNSSVSDARPVRIAILDSGIKLSQDNKDMYNFDPKIKYQSWVDQDTEWKDEAGHGTHLAILLRKIAPNAIVHVGRVFKKKPTEFSVSKIAEAIRYAVDEWKVDIIVMSFGFGEEHEELDNAIQHAAYKQVLMFAAASNDGKNRPDGVAWPAKDHSVICCHSGDGNGTHSSFTPSPRDGMKIMVLGECVKSAWPPHLKCTEDHRLMSGTSCAAPIAAGIAALILDYARGFLGTQEWKRLRRTTSMLRMFESMRDEHSTDGYWWIMHWKWFNEDETEGWIQREIRRIL